MAALDWEGVESARACEAGALALARLATAQQMGRAASHGNRRKDAPPGTGQSRAASSAAHAASDPGGR
eukprot:808259-Prymnesium_polylepis.1